MASDGMNGWGRVNWDDLMTPGFSTERPGEWASTMKEKEMINKAIDVKKTSMRAVVVDPNLGLSDYRDMPEPEESVDIVVTLAKEITDHIKENPSTFMLGQPAQLTVKKKDGSYAKRPHIGGEHFISLGAYIGKRHSLVFTFAPQDVADYAVVEMSEADANKLFGGFKQYIENASRTFNEVFKKANRAKAEKAELASNKNRFDTYADLGFGSF